MLALHTQFYVFSRILVSITGVVAWLANLSACVNGFAIGDARVLCVLCAFSSLISLEAFCMCI